MIYNVTSDFTRINESSGTIQNDSYIYAVEVSDKAVVDSGILLYPLNKFSFSGTRYMRCTDAGGWAEIRVVPFFVDGGIFSGDTSTTDDTQDATDDDTSNIIDDAWNGDYQPDDDTNEIIDDMWTSPDGTDTGDGFSDFLDDVFTP